MDQTALENANINVKEALNRLMGSEALFERLLKKFVATDYCEPIEQAISLKDAQAAADASHALKGVAGNLSITGVYELSSHQCELFRAGRFDEGAALLPQLIDEITQVHQAIKSAF